MGSPYYSEQENNDANVRLPQAVDAMQSGDFATARTLLDSILANVPDDYRYAYERDDKTLVVKFWDQEDFLYYIAHHSPEHNVEWQSNAYGKAYFYRGFLCIKNGSAFEALQWLDRGIALEPHKPLFYLEKGKAFQLLKQPEAAMDEYEIVLAQGDTIAPTPRSAAMRGKGFQLIELDRLDEAERIFHESLQLAPNNPVALNELEYIQQLRAGGQTVPIRVAEVASATYKECAICGESITNGFVFDNHGRLLCVCKPCDARLKAANQKKWWQFWRR